MAIRRCPYCKAIIDGVAEYCSNCGTQLLFPEDESKEEEIPGDKIVEEEDKEEEPLKAKEEELEEEPLPEDEEEEEEEIEEEEEEEIEEEAEIEIATPTPIEKKDIEDAEALKMREARELVKKETEKLWVSVGTEGERRSTSVDIEMPMSPKEARRRLEDALEKEHAGEDKEMKAQREPLTEKEKQEMDLRKIRLRRTPDTEKREKEEIERFVESLKEERGEVAPPLEEEIPLAEEIDMEEREEIDLQSIRMRRTPDTEKREKEEIERFVESIKKEREKVKDSFTPEEEIIPPPKEMGEETSEVKERIPPWAEKIKEKPPQELKDREEERKIEEPVELTEDFKEKEIKTQEDEAAPPTAEPPPQEAEPPLPTAEPPLSEKEMGFPEEVDHKVPFAWEIREKRKRAMKRRRSRYYSWLKARAFDFVFIAAFSIICLGLASRLMGISLLRLISASGPPVLVFYFVFLLFYFGFFMLFLGETPGDRLFPRD